jgi:hypothetical protein
LTRTRETGFGAAAARHFALLAAVGIVAGALMVAASAQGLGADPDSTVYLAAAHQLLGGGGMAAHTAPLIHFPPAYPLLLAGTGALGGEGDALAASRWLHVALFAVNVMLVAYAIRRCAAGDGLAALCGALCFVCSAPVLRVHAYLWSEAPFITCTLGAALLLSSYAASPTSWSLVGGAALAGLLPLIRYAGIGPICAFALAFEIAVRRRPERRDRWRHRVIAAVLAGGPLLLWLLRNRLVGDSWTDRSFVVHPIAPRQLVVGLAAIRELLLPGVTAASHRLGTIGVGASSGLVAFASMVAWRERRSGGARWRDRELTLSMILGAFAVTSLSGVLVARTFFDAAIPLDTRLLLPSYTLGFIPAFAAAWRVVRTLRRRWVSASVGALLAAALAINGHEAWAWTWATARVGQGYASRSWDASGGMAYIRALPAGSRIASNDPWAIRFLTHRDATLIPIRTMQTTQRSNPQFGAELASLCHDVRSGGTHVVWLDHSGSWFADTRGALHSSCPFLTERALSDGAVFDPR